jgi:phage shock protein A
VKLDAWVVTAGEELHREVLEVLKATQDARAAGNQTAQQIQDELSAQAKQLGAAETRIEELRKGLWTSKDGASVPEVAKALDAPVSGA